jgi:LysM repeat protein
MADNRGFFPWKVQDIVLAVTTAIDDAIEASHEPVPRRRAPQKRVNTAQRVDSTKDVLMEDAQKEVPKQAHKILPTVTPKESPRKAEPELVSEKGEDPPIVEFSKEVVEPKIIFPDSADNDWELLSERASIPSMGGDVIFVARAGSVRSIASIDQSNNSSQTTLSVPFKIQRTLSSSTIDSQDNALGPSGLGVLGVDYVEHVVLPTDTLQGICIAYKVSASNLRRANHFTGHSLHSAPKKLLIPLSKQALRTGYIRVQDTDSKEYKLHYFQVEFPDINMAEAKA